MLYLSRKQMNVFEAYGMCGRYNLNPNDIDYPDSWAANFYMHPNTDH